jgi:hypothetical protein
MWKLGFKTLGVILLITLIGWAVKLIFFPVHIVDKTIDTAYKVVDKTLDADNVIYNYEWFKRQYQDYKAIQTKIAQAENSVKNFEKSAGERSKWTFEDKNEYSRLNSITDGLKYQAEDIKAEYNARSKIANRSIFKTGELPEILE